MKRLRMTLAIIGSMAVGWPWGATTAGEADLRALDAKLALGPSPADLARYAYQANPMIQAAREDWKAAVERYRVETGLPNPELMLEGMYLTETLGEEVAPEDWTVRLTQGIPLPGRLGKAGDVATADARIAKLRLDAAVRDVTVQIREAYQELLYIQEARRVASQNRDLLDQLRRVGENAFAQNRAALVDVMKAQSQSGQLQYDVLLLEELERTEKTRMNSLLSRPADAPIGPLADEPPRPLVYQLEEIYPLTEVNLEEIRIAKMGVEKAQAMLELARYENLPEFTLGLSYGRQNEANQVGLQAGFMLPVWFGKNAGRLGAARADLEKMRAMTANQVNETRATVRDTYFRLQNSERLIRLYRDDLIPQAARAMEVAENRSEQGQGGFSDYAEAQSAWYNFQLALARAKADFGKFLARLEKLAGRSLTERAGGTKEGAK